MQAMGDVWYKGTDLEKTGAESSSANQSLKSHATRNWAGVQLGVWLVTWL